jgi:peptide/nickel transport system permease protein
VLLPVSGSGDLTHLVLPAITLALPHARPHERDWCGRGMLEVLKLRLHPHRACQGPARATGAAAITQLKNACLPLVTQAGLELGDMVGSAFIIETVFAWPGIGRMTVNAVQQRDFLVVQGCVLVIAIGFVLINLRSTCCTPPSTRA